MFTLPSDATDEQLRDGVNQWFTLVASGALAEAAEFLDDCDSPVALTVEDYVARVAELTSGGKPSIPAPIPRDVPPDELPTDGPIDIVCRWIPGAKATEEHPGFVADILHTIPVDGEWPEIDASFFVRLHNDRLSLQLRGVILYPDE